MAQINNVFCFFLFTKRSACCPPRVILQASWYYTLGTALIGRPFLTMTGIAQFEAKINFLQKTSIMGGLFLLFVTGAGRITWRAHCAWDVERGRLEAGGADSGRREWRCGHG
ncbi:MAG: hypothetical protein POH28_12565 [Acidocella sp.]|nr:hypothetical protein [Acidocella sp.]